MFCPNELMFSPFALELFLEKILKYYFFLLKLLERNRFLPSWEGCSPIAPMPPALMGRTIHGMILKSHV